MTQESKMEDIYIVTCKLDYSFDIILKSSSNDPQLVEKIILYSDELKKEGIEVFKQVNNILVAENGYYIAVFESDIEEIKE